MYIVFLFIFLGAFSWKIISTTPIPYITRIIAKKKISFVSVRIVESDLLKNYLHFFHPDIYKCATVKSYLITESEAKLLTAINFKHSDILYGKDTFYANIDYIVRLEDVIEFYSFLETCYNKLSGIQTDGINKCGFIRINNESVVPYCLKDNQKFLPLFYFEGETDNLRSRSINIENWTLSYLKLCCKVQGIRNELYESDSCFVTNLDDIKDYFPPSTTFEEFWPAKVIDTKLITRKCIPSLFQPGFWTQAPPAIPNEVPVSDNILQCTLSTPALLLPTLNIPITNGTHQHGLSSNQVVMY